MRGSPLVRDPTSSVLDALDRRPWTDRAACRDLGDDDVMFPELPTDPSRTKLESASILLPLLICSRCPVRRACLEESLEPVWYTRREETEERPEAISQQWVDGVWGGTLQQDRWVLRRLPVADAVDQLEGSFAERLQLRIEAYRRWRKKAPIKRQDAVAVDALLAERGEPVKHFHFHPGHPGGPGRGHRGPIALLAAELGVSRSTAWRRLRVSQPV